VKRKTKKYLSTLLASAMVFSSMLSNVSLVSAATEENIISDSTDVNTSGDSVILNTSNSTDSAKVTDDEEEQDEVKTIAENEVELAAEATGNIVTSSSAVDVKTGDEFTVEFNISDNPGINNATFFVKYDPKVVRAIDSGKSTVGYKGKALILSDKVKGQLALKPNKADNEDYAAISAADGTVSASALGLIKVAGQIEEAVDNDSTLAEAKDDGTLFGLKFQAVGVGDSRIGIVASPTDEVVTPSAVDSNDESFKGSKDVKRVIDVGSTSVSVKKGAAAIVGRVSKEDENYLTVSYDVTLNPGFNNATFYVNYDPTYLKAVRHLKDEVPENIGINGTEFINAALIRQQIEYVPTPSNSDYAGLGADGIKTAAELGRIKLAAYVEDSDKDGNLLEVTESGTLFSIKFEKLKDGKTDINLVQIPKDNGFVGADNVPLAMEVTNLKDVEVKKGETPIPPVEEAVISGTVSESEDGKLIYVDYKIENNPGFDSAKFFVTYNPNIIQAVNDKSNQTVIGNLINADKVNKEINRKPYDDDPDYIDIADGNTIAAVIGKIKFDVTADANIKEDGTLFRMAFKKTTIKGGTTSIEIKDAEFTSNGKKVDITIKNAPETKVNEITLGDADVNGIIDAQDAAIVLSYSLNSSEFDMKAEERAVDVDGIPYSIDANDAAWILTKVLDNSRIFPALSREKE